MDPGSEGILSSIYEAITAIMAEVDAIDKSKKNKEQGFMFRGIDDVYNMVHPLLAKHGVFSIPEVMDERTEERKSARGGNLIYRMLKMKYTFFAQDGSNVAAIVIGEGMDTGDKASNKAMAVAHKYALIQIFSIPTCDLDDPDAETPPPSEPVYKPAPAVRQFDIINLTKILDDAVLLGLINTDQKAKKLDFAQGLDPARLPAYIVKVENDIKLLEGLPHA